MNYEERIEQITALEGYRVRLTWPNGGQISGEVAVTVRPLLPGIRANLKPEFRDEPDPVYVSVGDRTEDGNWAYVEKVEVMQANGRYGAFAWLNPTPINA